MSVLENFTKKVTETARAAAKKSSDLVEVTKLNLSIGSEEDKIEKVYAEIGKIVYQSFSKGERVSDDFNELCERIQGYQENIKNMKQKVLELKKVKMCSSCNAILTVDAAFCSKCGAKQEVPEIEVEEVIEKICPACSMSNTMDSTYCSKCGTKLD